MYNWGSTRENLFMFGCLRTTKAQTSLRWFETDFVGNHEARFSRVAAQSDLEHIEVNPG